ncbi:MAG: BolA family protein [Halothiobacillaceae bacterium]
MNDQEITDLIQKGLPGAEVHPEGEGCSFKITVISEAFAGKSLIEQHRMVNALLAEPLRSGALHAVTLDTRTP